MTEDPESTSFDVQVVVRDAAWSRAWPDRRGRLESAARLALARGAGDRAPDRRAELAIVLADDELLRDLNRTYRGKDAATNVLAFEGSDASVQDHGDALHLGDVLLARETIAREAKAQIKRFEDHAVHLTVHGVLHLLGHEHETDEDAERMEALEISILEELGIADPYRDARDLCLAASKAE